MGSIPELGRSSREGNGNPLQYSCLRNPLDRGVWQAIVHGGHKSVRCYFNIKKELSPTSPEKELEKPNCLQKHASYGTTVVAIHSFQEELRHKPPTHPLYHTGHLEVKRVELSPAPSTSHPRCVALTVSE